jgi:hypothetical protein
MCSDNLKNEKQVILDAIYDQKAKGVFSIGSVLRILMYLALFVSVVVGVIKLVSLYILSFFTRGGERCYRNRANVYWISLRATPIMLRLLS